MALTEARDRIERLSRTDELTGVYNRRRLFDLAEKMLSLARRQGFPVAVLMIDLDHFKKINDQYGHLAGDDVLREVAARIQSEIRDTDVFGRFGGEEFALAAPDLPAEETSAYAERLRRAVSRTPVSAQGQPVDVTISIGATNSQYGGLDLEKLLHQADMAMYQAKRRGRNQVCLGD
jgi:diguanylate cyclase (GGDEF)-like protein